MADTAYVDWYSNVRRQNWRTPSTIFNALHAEYGFTLDGAADEGNALLPRASTASRPRSWAGERVFCNPPWSAIAPFVELAATADLAVLLVPARTNVRWFHRALELGAVPRYFLGRPKFENPEHGGAGHNSPVDCMFLVFGEAERGIDVERLARAIKNALLVPDVVSIHDLLSGGMASDLAREYDHLSPSGVGSNE